MPHVQTKTDFSFPAVTAVTDYPSKRQAIAKKPENALARLVRHGHRVVNYSFELSKPSVFGEGLQLASFADVLFQRAAIDSSFSLVLLTEQVVDAFSRLSKVQSVFRSVDSSGITFYVFTSNEEYDDELASELAREELKLRNAFSDIAQDYENFPIVLIGEPDQVVGNAQAIFQR